MIPAWENGKLKPIEKLEVHKRALRHKAVSVFLISGSETLIQQRALSKYHTPGLWANACCTHPFWEEKPVECARRRLNEELGIKTNLEFHRTLYLRAQAPAMLATVETVWLQLGPTMRSLYGKLQRKEPPHFHRIILSALSAGDEPGLRVAVRSDVTQGLRMLTS